MPPIPPSPADPMEARPSLQLRALQADDVEPIVSAFAALGWPGKTHRLYEHYLAEQAAGNCVVLVALCDGRFCGYVTVAWESDYAPFRARSIPEIQDLNVLPPFRRRGIAGRLLDEAERRIAERSPVVGIGVGLHASYGAAQRLYVRRGYLPDGRGLVYRGQAPAFGQSVTVDDDLALYLSKALPGGGGEGTG